MNLPQRNTLAYVASMLVKDKLECLPLVRLSSLILYFEVRLKPNLLLVMNLPQRNTLAYFASMSVVDKLECLSQPSLVFASKART